MDPLPGNTYIPTHEGWLYLAAIVDIYSRKVVGWAMDKKMTSDLGEKALKMAIQLPIIHSKLSEVRHNKTKAKGFFLDYRLSFQEVPEKGA